MNGARALLSTLVDADVDVCFANPGTSEMHFVAALDDVPAMRGILCLFEGVVTGAADGYGRVAGRPAATLLHLGPGLGNGLANLHNARRARTPIVNIVGDHATYHARYDAPLQSDIASIAGTVSGWYRSTARADDVAADGADAVAAAFGPPGCVATLVLPADASWSDSATGPCPPRPRTSASRVAPETVDGVAKALRSLGHTVHELDPIKPGWNLPPGTEAATLSASGRLWAWTAVLSSFLLFPLFVHQVNAFIPIGAAALGVGLYTFFHPGLRRGNGEDEEDGRQLGIPPHPGGQERVSEVVRFPS